MHQNHLFLKVFKHLVLFIKNVDRHFNKISIVHLCFTEYSGMGVGACYLY